MNEEIIFRSRQYRKNIDGIEIIFRYETPYSGRSEDELRKESDLKWVEYLELRNGFPNMDTNK